MSNGKDAEVDLIYTVYDGLIIRTADGSYCKQDKLLDFVLRNITEKK